MSHARPILRFVLWVVAHPRTTLAITLAITALCGALAATRLRLSTDQNKLFSAKVPFFKDYLEFDRRFPENEALYVIIEPKTGKPPVERWTAAADAVVEQLKGSPHVVSVSARVPLDELGRQGLLFEDSAKLRGTVEEARRFVPLVKLVGEKPNLLTGLLGPTPLDRLLGGLTTQAASAETGAFVGVVAESLRKTVEGEGAGRGPQAGRLNGVVLPDLQKLDASDPSRLGYYYVPDESDRSRHLLLVRVHPRVNFDSLTAISEAVEDLRAAVRDVAGRFPEFTFGTTGRPALAADEMRTTDEDSTRAEIVALTAVFIGIAVVFRSVWLAIASELALGVGIGWTFGWATLTVGELNLLSIVFFLALIGIGMDYLVQILSRYRVEAARRTNPKLVWVAVFRQVGAPINTACLGAAGAFLVSLFTDFAGAADLGLIAGGGLLLCLLAGYTFLPAILTLFPVRPRAVKEARPAPAARPERPLRRLMVTPTVWALLLLAGIPFATRTGFNANLLDLQVPNVESVRLVRKLETWSAVVLSKDLSVLRAARDAVAASPEVERTESILTAYDNYAALKSEIRPLPKIDWAEPAAVDSGGAKRLADKAANLADRYAGADPTTADVLRTLANSLRAADPARAAEQLSAWQKGFVDQLREMLAQFSPEPLDLPKVPKELRSHLVGDDGVFALYVYPKADLWAQENLARFVDDVEARVKALPAPQPTLTGIAHNIHHSTSSIRDSFYKATFYALGLIFVLVLIDVRKLSDTLLAISVLAMGLPMLVALMGLFGVDWNFANFFGLPILIGAGHEYGVFMVHRYRESRDNPRRPWDQWDVADTALALCAFVTSSSFGFFFLLANHRGLKSLGLVMAVGSACIYLATVLALRPLLLWRLRRRRERASAA